MEISNQYIDEHCVPKGLKEKPFDYQYDGIRMLAGKARFLLGDDPGLGKTIQSIVAVNLLQKHSERLLNVLVICTKGTLLNWPRETAKWSNGPACYTVINHDKLIGKDHAKYLKDWDVVIADEVQFYGINESAMRVKVFLQIIQRAKRVWMMSATVGSTTAEDYYQPFRQLLPAIFMKWSRSQFKKVYCEKVKDLWAFGGYSYVGFNEKKLPELKLILDKCCLRRKQEVVKKDLPELTITDVFIEADHKIPDFSYGEKFDMLEKVKQGKEEPLSTEYQTIIMQNGLAKIPAVLEMLNTLPADKGVVIFVHHRTIIDELNIRIKSHTSRKVGMITGSETSATKRQATIDDFQSGKLNTLILSIQGAVGMNLTAATLGIYMQYPYSPRQWRQSMKRIHRIGSKEPVQVIKLMIKGTSDEEIFGVLSERLEITEELGV